MTVRPDWLTDDDVVRMERAHVRAWPALETQAVQGWLCRRSGGGSQRANSVSTVDFDGKDVDAALDEVEALYRAWGAPARLQTYDLTCPAELPTRLQDRRYGRGEATVTMFKRLAGGSLAPRDVDVRDQPDGDWLDVYLGEITESRRTVNQVILQSIPAPRAFFLCQRNGRALSTALCVIDGGCAVVECVATRADARRQGSALAVLSALESWAGGQGATMIGLQVVATNVAAIGLYERLGYLPGARNHFWIQSGSA